METNKQCPICHNNVTSINPYYGAEEKEFDLAFINQLWLYIPASLLFAVWWPLGIAGAFITYYSIRYKAKSTVLYKCKSCNKNFSLNELEDT